MEEVLAEEVGIGIDRGSNGLKKKGPDSTRRAHGTWVGGVFYSPPAHFNADDRLPL